MLKGLKTHKLGTLQWQRTVIVPLLFMRSYGGTQEPFLSFFNTLDDRASEELVTGEEEASPARSPPLPPNLAPHLPSTIILDFATKSLYGNGSLDGEKL